MGGRGSNSGNGGGGGRQSGRGRGIDIVTNTGIKFRFEEYNGKVHDMSHATIAGVRPVPSKHNEVNMSLKELSQRAKAQGWKVTNITNAQRIAKSAAHEAHVADRIKESVGNKHSVNRHRAFWSTM